MATSQPYIVEHGNKNTSVMSNRFGATNARNGQDIGNWGVITMSVKVGDWVYGTEDESDALCLGFVRLLTSVKVYAYIAESDDVSLVGKSRTLTNVRQAPESSPDPRLMAEFALIRGDKEDFMYWSGMLKASC